MNVLRKEPREPVPERDRDRSVEHRPSARAVGGCARSPQAHCLDGETVSGVDVGVPAAPTRRRPSSATWLTAADARRLMAVFVQSDPGPGGAGVALAPMAARLGRSACHCGHGRGAVGRPSGRHARFHRSHSRSVAAPPSEELRAAAPTAAPPAAPAPSAASEPQRRVRAAAGRARLPPRTKSSNARLQTRGNALRRRTSDGTARLESQHERAPLRICRHQPPPASEEVEADKREVAATAAPQPFAARQAAVSASRSSPLEAPLAGESERSTGRMVHVQR